MKTFKGKLGYFISMGLLAFILGFIISAQSRIYFGFKKSDEVLSKNVDNLVVLLKETKNKNESLNSQLSSLKEQLQKISTGEVNIEDSTPEIKKIYTAAGLTKIKGKGIIITVDDTKLFDNKKLNYENLMHSDDLLKIVNILKASGASAISVNGQRLVTNSEIVTAENAIVINKIKIAPPYIIKATGPTNVMISGIRIRGGLAEYLEVFGISLNIKKSNNIVIPAYKQKS